MVMSHARPGEPALEPLLVSTGIVALAEIGDKTQLLALVLAARCRRPLPIIRGILIATLANHALAGVAIRMPRMIGSGRRKRAASTRARSWVLAPISARATMPVETSRGSREGSPGRTCDMTMPPPPAREGAWSVVWSGRRQLAPWPIGQAC